MNNILEYWFLVAMFEDIPSGQGKDMIFAVAMNDLFGEAANDD